MNNKTLTSLPHHLWEVSNHHSVLAQPPDKKFNSWQEFVEKAGYHRGKRIPKKPFKEPKLQDGMYRRDPLWFTHAEVLRWCWYEGPADGEKIGSRYLGRPHYHNGRLRLWIHRRRCDQFSLFEVRVCRNNEVEVAAFLTSALEFFVNSIWYPVGVNSSVVTPVEVHPWQRDRAVTLHADNDFFNKYPDEFWG